MGPFQKHQASPGELSGYASGLMEDAAEASENSQSTEQRYQPAIANWSGLAEGELQSAPTPLRNDASESANALAWAAVCAQMWADKVSTFNGEVDRITGELAALGSNWGATGTDGEPPTDDEVAEARSTAQAAARQQWWTAYNTHILDGEDEVSAMLAEGPTEENVQQASYHGGTVATIVSGFTDATVGGVAAWQASSLRRYAGMLDDAARHHNAAYSAPWQTAAGRQWHNMRAHNYTMQSMRVGARASSLTRTVGARLPVVGLGITAVGIGYDISQGKAPVQAIASGVGGAATGMYIGAMVGTAIPVPVVGTVVGAVVGAGVGWAVSTGIDWAFENSEAIGDAIGNGAEAVGNAISSGAEKVGDVFDSIF